MKSLIDECIQLQQRYNAIMNLWADTLIGDDMTPNVKDYTTEELERLTTLTIDTARPGEFLKIRPNAGRDGSYVNRSGEGMFILRNGEQAYLDGSTHIPTEGALHFSPRRRIRSFTDPTELDPPQDVMLAELKRRKEPPISNATHAGRRVRTTWGREGIIVNMDAKEAFDAKWLYVDRGEVAWLGDNGIPYYCAATSLELI